MSDKSYYVNEGFRCDGTGCTAEFTRPPVPGATGLHMQQAAAEGWQFWAARGRRAYCPSCAPKPGHRMREITP